MALLGNKGQCAVSFAMIMCRFVALIGIGVVLAEENGSTSPRTDRAEQAIRELVRRGAVVKRFEVREVESSGLLVRLKEQHLDPGGRVYRDILEWLSMVPSLAVELRSLPLKNDGLQELLAATSPIGLDVSGTKVTNRGLAAIATAAQLRLLDVGFTKVDDDGMTSLTKLRELRYVSFLGCRVTDSGIASLVRMTSLREVYLAETSISAAAVERLQALLPKCRVVR
jgi:hypothetical protein